MEIIKKLLLFGYFVLTMCGFRVTHGQTSLKPFTIWDYQDDHDDQPDQQMDTTTKRYLFECGVHGQKPTIDSLSTQTTLPGEWPWVVAIFNYNRMDHPHQDPPSFRCGGSLIDNRFIITTASCMDVSLNSRRAEFDDFAIIVGVRDVSHQIYDKDSTRFLTAMYMHEEYSHNRWTCLNNIALLVLKEPVTYSKLVKPVCIWEGEDDYDDLGKAIQHGTEVGWGKVDGVQILEAPQRFNVSIMSLTTCQEWSKGYYITVLTEKNFCGAAVSGKRIDTGFSGSGLFIEQCGRWMLRGIHAHYMSGTTVYVDVAKYRNWISNTTYLWLENSLLTSTLPPSTSTEKNIAWTQQCSKRDDVNTLVAGGQSTREGEWPWHVAIYHSVHVGSSSSISYKCGGSLISANHVLTVAHCFIDKLTNRPFAKSSISILLGTHNIKSLSVGVQLRLVDRLDIHKEYNPQTKYKDIALLKLSSPVEFTTAVRPVCLWPEDEVELSNVVGKNGSVVGWGNDEYGLLADELMLTELPVVSELTCLRSHAFFYNTYTNNYTFCAGLLQDTSVCNGDSGGGMVFKLRSGAGTEGWFLRGIVSLRRVTDKPCDPSSYVIFTDVAKYLDWIKDSVSRDLIS